MKCTSPVVGYRSQAGRSDNGKWPVVFNRNEGYLDLEVKMPCGRCRACRLGKARQWAVRCLHEAKQYEKNCFVTLTYNNENLPPGRCLVFRHFQLFMKRLRKEYGPNIKYYHCGEYGEQNLRPHYHACLFNMDFEDKKLWSVRDDVKLYTSEKLEKIWNMGHCIIGEVTFESAAYVARYIMKKWYGPQSLRSGRPGEYATMSKGIGKAFLKEYLSDVYPLDKVVTRGGRLVKPPRYYDDYLEKVDSELYERVKRERRCKEIEDDDFERLETLDKVQEHRANLLVRNL